MGKFSEMWEKAINGGVVEKEETDLRVQEAQDKEGGLNPSYTPSQVLKALEKEALQNAQNRYLQGQNMAIIGSGSPYQNWGQLGQAIGAGGLINSQYPTPPDPRDVQIGNLSDELNRARWELASQQEIRKQDAALLKRFFRMETWLNEAHPEVMEQFKAVNDLLKAAGEDEI